MHVKTQRRLSPEHIEIVNMCLFVCVHNLEAVLARWDVNSSQIDHVPELSVGVVPQEGQNRYDSIRMDHHFQLIIAGHLSSGFIRWQ